MANDFAYRFSAIRGTQASRDFYVSQCPLRLIPKLFQFDDEELPAEIRAQRALNRNRVPEMAAYLLENRNDYVFSALTASVDGGITFEPLQVGDPDERLGNLNISMDARFIINDGQHRRAAIEAALAEDSNLGDETIAVVFFLDPGLKRCQQMFADLNRYAVRPSASIGVLFDHRDPLATITRSVAASETFKKLVEAEKSSLAKRSKKLFTLSALHTATKAFFAFEPEDTLAAAIPAHTDELIAFWHGIATGIPEWRQVAQGDLSAAEVRRDYIHTFSVFLHAMGKVGAQLRTSKKPLWEATGMKLATLDLLRTNEQWEGRAMRGGRISKAGQNVTLTANELKRHIGLELSPDDLRIEHEYMEHEG